MKTDITTTCTRTVDAVLPLHNSLPDPVEPFTLSCDLSDYSKLADVMKDMAICRDMRLLREAGQWDTTEYQTLWREHETIKNKYGGMPPVPVC